MDKSQKVASSAAFLITFQIPIHLISQGTQIKQNESFLNLLGQQIYKAYHSQELTS